jgi:antitoxin HigA-1
MSKLKPIHPGEVLREELMAPLRLNANKLALALHVPAPTVYDIIHEHRSISPEMALRLGRFFRTTPDFWLNLQSEFDLRTVRHQKEAVVNQVRPRVLKRGGITVLRIWECDLRTKPAHCFRWLERALDVHRSSDSPPIGRYQRFSA